MQRRIAPLRTPAVVCAAALIVAFASSCESTTAPVPMVTGTGRRLSVGEATTCAIGSTNSAVWCWGQNSQFLEYGTIHFTANQPVVSLTSDFANMANGHGQHMCATSSTNVTKCWGRSTHGQLGSSVARTTSDTLLPLPFGDWLDVSVSRLTTCGVTSQHIAYCWGHNQRGEGGNSTRNIGEVTRVPLSVESTRDFKAIAAGWLHTCALTVSGELLCWGDNTSGQLGLGSTDSNVQPVPLVVPTNIRFEQISAGANYTCGISVEHAAYCWGQNATGELGDGTTTSRAVPTLVASPLKFKRIVTSTGFGSGSTVNLPNSIPGGIAHTCALTETDTAYCWGWNGAGQLGDGTFTDRLTPVAVSGGQAFSEIGLGGSHTCGLLNGAIWCWGGNLSGQLGIGSTANSATPKSVATPFNVPN